MYQSDHRLLKTHLTHKLWVELWAIIVVEKLTLHDGVKWYAKNDTSSTTKLRNKLIRGVIINLIVYSYGKRRKIKLKCWLIKDFYKNFYLKCSNINILISSWLWKFFQRSVNGFMIFSVFDISNITKIAIIPVDSIKFK